MYYGTMDEKGNVEVHHATIITSVDDNSINYAGNTNTRFDYPLAESFREPGNETVFIVHIDD